ncbi:MAG: hypothetical protein JRC77_10525, partial [Deltaproteobacteria bacterium]|nr:hypothetical protein [Deltaproteobacteria bacterium]
MHRQVGWLGLVLGVAGLLVGVCMAGNTARAEVQNEQVLESTCIHDDIQSQVEVRTIDTAAPATFRALEVAALSSPATSPIRITLDNSMLSSSTLSAGEKVQFETLTRNAADWLQSVLNVVPVVGDLSIDGTCTGTTSATVTVSNTDLLIFLSAETIASPTTVATAGFCDVDGFNRPLIAQVNLNPLEDITDAGRASFY